MFLKGVIFKARGAELFKRHFFVVLFVEVFFF